MASSNPIGKIQLITNWLSNDKKFQILLNFKTFELFSPCTNDSWQIQKGQGGGESLQKNECKYEDIQYIYSNGRLCVCRELFIIQECKISILDILTR